MRPEYLVNLVLQSFMLSVPFSSLFHSLIKWHYYKNRPYIVNVSIMIFAAPALIIGLSLLDLRCQLLLNKTQKINSLQAHISNEIILPHVDLQGLQ